MTTEIMTTHTQGPLTVRETVGWSDSPRSVFTADWQADPDYTGTDIVETEEEAKANAARLGACWNFCQGVDTASLASGTLAGLLSALNPLLDGKIDCLVHNTHWAGDSSCECPNCEAVRALRALLAQLEGGK